MPFLYVCLRDTISFQFSPNYKGLKLLEQLHQTETRNFFFFAKRHKYSKAMHRKALLEKLNNEHIEINILQI